MGPAEMSIRVGADVQGAVSGLNQVAAATTKATAALGKVPNVSNQATQSLTNLSRVAQDAPYGFIGIANNINPLLESFQRLKASTGSTGGALKALGSSLTGAGGIGLALGVVSSLAVVFGDKLFGASKSAKAAAEANKELAGSIASDLVKLTSLVGLIQNVNTSNEDRIKGLKAVNEQYGKYLPNLEKEGITAENIARSYDLITDSLLRQAVVKGIQKEIQELVEKTAQTLIKVEKEEEKRRNSVDKSTDAVVKQKTGIEKAAEQQDRYNKTVRDGELALIGQRKEFTKSAAENFNYAARVAFLRKELMAQLAPLLNLTKSFQDLDVTIKPDKIGKPDKIDLEPFFKDNIKPIKLKLPWDQILFDEIRLGKDLKTFAEKLQDYSNSQISKAIKPFKLNLTPEAIANAESVAAMRIAGEKLASSFAQSIGSGLGDAISAVGEGIGNVLSGKSFGNEIFQVLGGLLQSLGKALIQFAVVDKIIKQILANPFTLGPGIALAAGIAAIAAGQLIKSGSMRGRAGGGPVSSGMPYMVGENGPEMFYPETSGRIQPAGSGRVSQGNLSGLMGNVVFSISGNNLIGVFANANRSQSRLV